MATIDTKITDLQEKLKAPSDSWIHFVDPSDFSQDPKGSSYKIKKDNFIGKVNLTVKKYTSESQLPGIGDLNTVYFLNVSNVKYLKYWDGTQYLNASAKPTMPFTVQDFFRDFYAKKSSVVLANYNGKCAQIAVIEDEDNGDTFTHYFYNGTELQWIVSVNQ